jgi:uncharacterized protein (DUF427 family)
VVAGETVAQSAWAKLLHETGLVPSYYLPEADVRAELLQPTEHTSHCPFKGDAIRSDLHVVVKIGGEVVADSRRPTRLFETGLQPRFYLPEDDVDLARLERTGTETSCPYKGPTRARSGSGPSRSSPEERSPRPSDRPPGERRWVRRS